MSLFFVIPLLWIGGLFILVAAFGLVVFPDVFLRMHAAAKSGTVGVAALVIAVAVFFPAPSVAIPALLIAIFFFMTAPVATHLLGRAAYWRRVPLWERTVCDEHRGSGTPEAVAQSRRLLYSEHGQPDE